MGTANTAMRSQSVETGMLTFYFVAMLFTDAVIVLAYYKPEYQGLLNDLVVEDSFYEFGTVLFLFIAAALGLSALWRKEHYRLRRRDKTFLFCVAFLLFVAAMEELNWGQRIFDFEVTYVMERARGQVNLHNLFPPRAGRDSNLWNDLHFFHHNATGYIALSSGSKVSFLCKRCQVYSSRTYRPGVLMRCFDPFVPPYLFG